MEIIFLVLMLLMAFTLSIVSAFFAMIIIYNLSFLKEPKTKEEWKIR